MLSAFHQRHFDVGFERKWKPCREPHYCRDAKQVNCFLRKGFLSPSRCLLSFFLFSFAACFFFLLFFFFLDIEKFRIFPARNKVSGRSTVKRHVRESMWRCHIIGQRALRIGGTIPKFQKRCCRLSIDPAMVYCGLDDLVARSYYVCSSNDATESGEATKGCSWGTEGIAYFGGVWRYPTKSRPTHTPPVRHLNEFFRGEMMGW